MVIGSKLHIMQTLNLTLPTCWQELTPAQLRYLFYLLSLDKFTADEIKTYVLFRWAHIEVISPEGDGFFVRHEGKPLHLTALQIAEVLPFLSWLARLPTYPVRLPQICGHSACAADLQGLSFEDYISCDNFYTGFLFTGDNSHLYDIAAILYGAEPSRKFHLSPEEYISIFYWFGSAKEHLARRFTHFFHTAPLNQETDLGKHLQELVDTQIRALTKGDITKEETVLKMDVWRALTELDAQAADAEELKCQMHQS